MLPAFSSTRDMINTQETFRSVRDSMMVASEGPVKTELRAPVVSYGRSNYHPGQRVDLFNRNLGPEVFQAFG